MANRLTKLQKLVYTPAVAPTPARDAYCVTSGGTQSYSGLNFSGGNTSGAVQPELTFQFDSFTFTISYTSTNYTPYAPEQVATTTCYPAIAGKPGSPARVEVLDNFGWDAGARSIEPVPESGYFRATLPPSPIGVQIGLCLRDFASSYSEMPHSLVARRELYTIVERGSTVFGPFALAASATVEVRRQGGTVSYLVNGVEVYQSATPSAGEVYGGALLYSVTDYADAPALGALEALQAFSAQLPALRAAISDSADYNVALLEMPPLTLSAVLDVVYGDIQFSATLPALRAAISESAVAAWMTAELPALSLHATLGQAEEIPNNFLGLMPPLTLSAHLRAGQAVEFSATIPLAFVAADIAGYSQMSAELPLRLRLAIREPYLPSDTADGSDALAALDLHSLETALLLVAIDSLDVSESAELVIVLELAGLDSLDLSDSASLGSIIEMLAVEQVSIISHAGAARQQALQYAVNYLTGALTTYSDFDFLGFTQHAGQAFAWRADGLYRLGVDSNEVVQVLADFGATDYGDARVKGVEAAFVGVRTDGQCYLRLTADDGIERVYRLLGNGNQKRAELAKGVASRYWNLRLELTDTSFATIDNIELAVGVTQRRGFSRSS